MKPKYSMTIRWSEEDQAFLVWLPEFDGRPQTHGDTYEEAARRGAELIESHIGWLGEEGQQLPAPDVYVDGGDAPAPTPSGASAGV